MKLGVLAVLTLILTGTTALILVRPQAEIPITTDVYAVPSRTGAPIPKITGEGMHEITAQGAAVVDATSGTVLFEKSANSPLRPASTTKIMTALVAMDHYNPDDVVEVGRVKVDGHKMGLVPGEKITARDLFFGLLVFSGNDAAEVLAQNYPDGREAFIAEMNKKAAEMGLTHTTFKNPSGLDENGHMSSARDLIILGKAAMNDLAFSEYVGVENIQVKSIDGQFVHNLANTNELLGAVEGVLGVKTGWTEKAQENLVTFVERDGRRVFITVLGSNDRFGETEELIEWVFGNVEWVEI